MRSSEFRYAWFELYSTVTGVTEGLLIGAKRLGISLLQSTFALLRPDRPTHSELLIPDRVYAKRNLSIGY